MYAMNYTNRLESIKHILIQRADDFVVLGICLVLNLGAWWLRGSLVSLPYWPLVIASVIVPLNTGLVLMSRSDRSVRYLLRSASVAVQLFVLILTAMTRQSVLS